MSLASGARNARRTVARFTLENRACLMPKRPKSSNLVSQGKSVRGLQAESGPQPEFPVVLGQKNEIQCESELDSSHNSRPRSVEQPDSASAASCCARSISPVSIAFLAD